MVIYYFAGLHATSDRLMFKPHRSFLMRENKQETKSKQQNHLHESPAMG